MQTALVIGHTRLSKGAYSPYLSKTEFDFHKELLKDFENVFTYNPLLGYSARVNEMANKTKDFENVLEFHFNSSESTQANGCEALYYFKNKKTKDFSNYFCEMINNAYGIKNRGAKGLYNKNQRGFGQVSKFKGNTIILEPFFGSNSVDIMKFERDAGVEQYKDVIKQYIEVL